MKLVKTNIHFKSGKQFAGNINYAGVSSFFDLQICLLREVLEAAITCIWIQKRKLKSFHSCFDGPTP